MPNTSIFDKLFIFEMANNHMGDVEHGLEVIRRHHEVSRHFDFRFAFKLQYRYLDTFIHPAFKARSLSVYEQSRSCPGDYRSWSDECY